MASNQSLTVDYRASTGLDGLTPAPRVRVDGPDRTTLEVEAQIYQPEEVAEFGLIDPDLGDGGSIGPRAVTQLLIDLQGAVAPVGARVAVVAEKDDELVELYEVLDMTGLSVGVAPVPFVIPQGALLQLEGMVAGAEPILVRVSIETPKDVSFLLATLALVPAPPPAPPPADGNNYPMEFGVQSLQGAGGNPRYLWPGSGRTVAQTTPIGEPAPVASTLERLVVQQQIPAVASAETITYTVMVGGVATAATVTVPATTGTVVFSPAVSVPVPAGALVALRATRSGNHPTVTSVVANALLKVA
jgi:hypothetical protein